MVRIALAFFLVIFSINVLPSPQAAPQSIQQTVQPTPLTDPAAAFFDDSEVREIRIAFDDPNWYNTLFQSHNTNPEDPYFPCRFQSGNTSLDRIGCRFKGGSSFRRNGIKKPFKLDFNEYDDDVNFLGLKKLNLNNFDLSPDFMREKLLLDFAGKYVAALRSVYVRLYINDVFYGLYLAVEQPDKTMMQSRYGDDEDGNLYEGEEQMGTTAHPNLAWLGANQSAYENVYLLKTNEEANDFSGLIQFLDILNNAPMAELPTRLEAVCDVENWLYGMAANNLVVNLDSYIGVGAEYYLYDRDRDGKFVHIQWDHNESFGITGDGTPRLANPFITDPFYLPGGGVGGNNARPFLQRVWAVNDYRRLYLRIFSRFLREGFDEATMGARVEQLATLIRPHVYADPNKTFSNAQFETTLNNQITSGLLTLYGINQFVRERYNYLRPYLNSQALPSDVRLNEIVAVNNGAYRDAAGDADPWVELHNPGPGPVTLTGFYLSDDAANPTKWQIPARTLADGEFLVVWLDGETSEGETHANFRLQTAGGNLYLYANASSLQTPIDTIAYPALVAGQSMIRLGDYGAQWTTTFQTTPGTVNITTGATPPSTGTGLLLVNEIAADNDGAFEDPDEPGAFEDWFEVYNPGTTTVDMSGMYITDNLSNRTKWRVPNGVTIPAGGHLVFIADGETGQGNRHTSWSLSADGEAIGIYDTDGTTLIDSHTFGTQQTDISLGRTTDGAASWSIFQPSTPGAANALAYVNWITSSASFLTAPVSPNAIASAFGENLTANTVLAEGTTLPTSLGGVTIAITDSAGVARNASLFFVSPGQVNFHVPAETATGRARVVLHRQNGTMMSGDLLIEAIAPGLFAANADGQGIAALGALRVDSTGAQTPLAALAFDAAQQRFVGVPVSLGAGTDQVFLIFYGVGIRGLQSLSDISIEIGGQSVPVPFAGAQGSFIGLDQINVGPLPRSLVGRGTVNVIMTLGNRRANRVTVTIE